MLQNTGINGALLGAIDGDTLGSTGGDEDMNHFSGGGTQETYADTNDSNVNAGGWMMKGGANVQPTIILNYIIKT